MVPRYKMATSRAGKLFKAGGNKEGIQVQKIRGKSEYKLTYTSEMYGKQTFKLSEEAFQRMLDKAEGYRNTEAFFKSSFWETEGGKLQQEQNLRTNFGHALQHYTEVDPKLRRYVRNLYKEMSDQQKKQFLDENYIFVEEVFHYDEIRNDVTGDWEESKKDQTAELKEIARRLESYATDQQIKVAKSVQSTII